MRECFDEGMLQSYFDGELSRKLMESVASHLSSCLVCTQAVRELESESALLMEALAPEFALSVPTEQLRQRIDAVIAGQRVVNPSGGAVSRWARPFTELFILSPQKAFGYAGLAAVLVLVAVVAAIMLKQSPRNNQVAVQPPQNVPAKTASNLTNVEVKKDAVAAVKNVPDHHSLGLAGNASKKSIPRRSPAKDSVDLAHVKLLPGERSYLKTIAQLDTTIKADNDTSPMRPGLQAEYERNLAMVDRAIATTRTAVKKNPNDSDAAEFMYAAYQTKVDLLNQVADARLANRQH